MREFIVTVEEFKSKFIYQLLKEFDYVQIKRRKKKLTAEDENILNGISEAVEEINLAKKGETKLIDVSSYLEDLKKDGFL